MKDGEIGKSRRISGKHDDEAHGGGGRIEVDVSLERVGRNYGFGSVSLFFFFYFWWNHGRGVICMRLYSGGYYFYYCYYRYIARSCWFYNADVVANVDGFVSSRRVFLVLFTSGCFMCVVGMTKSCAIKVTFMAVTGGKSLICFAA